MSDFDSIVLAGLVAVLTAVFSWLSTARGIMLGLAFTVSVVTVGIVAVGLGLSGWEGSVQAIPVWVLMWAFAFGWTAFAQYVVKDIFQKIAEDATEKIPKERAEGKKEGIAEMQGKVDAAEKEKRNAERRFEAAEVNATEHRSRADNRDTKYTILVIAFEQVQSLLNRTRAGQAKDVVSELETIAVNCATELKRCHRPDKPLVAAEHEA